MKIGDNGFVKTSLFLRYDQYLWLRATALEQQSDHIGPADASALVRAMIDMYISDSEKTAKRKRAVK